MRYVTLWLLLLTSAFWLFALPRESEGREQIETRPPAQSGADFFFVWPDGRRAPAMLLPNGIATLPDGSVPQGGITLQLPNGQRLPVSPDGRVDLPRFQGIQDKDDSNRQPGIQQAPGTYPPAGTGPQGESRIPLYSLSQDDLAALQRGEALQYHPNGQLTPVTVLPDGSVRLQDGSVPKQSIQLLLPDGSLVTLSPGEKLDPAKLDPRKNRQPSSAPAVAPPTAPQAGGHSETPAELPSLPTKPAQPEDMLAALLPTTPIPQDFQAPGSRGKSPDQSQQKQDNAPKAPRTPRKGEPLNIPPEAAKTGDLGFLEGCWQGTRPEYYSKRTIRECFCFGKRGANGKRRIFDPSGSRQCIGATRASLSKNGVLHVYSESAYCSDGVKWGGANMTCRGNGKSTPCSWVFTDANGARQSYEINFVRVESCRR